jgi:hypothetical protein
MDRAEMETRGLYDAAAANADERWALLEVSFSSVTTV